MQRSLWILLTRFRHSRLHLFAILVVVATVAGACGKGGGGSSDDDDEMEEPERPRYERPEPNEHDPTDIVVDQAGILYLLTPQLDQVVRYDVVTSLALEPITVSDNPTKLTYSASHDRLYLGYEDGRVTKIDLAGVPLVEQAFLLLDQPVIGLEGAGQFLYVITPEDDRLNNFDHRTFDSMGTPMSELRARMDPADVEWNEETHQLYGLAYRTSQTGLIWTQVDPVTGELTWGLGRSVYRIFGGGEPPIRVTKDGTRVALASGEILDGQSGEFVGQVRGTRVDLTVFSEGSVVTIDVGALYRTNILQWSPEQTLFADDDVDGYPVRMVDTPFGTIIVFKEDGLPTFRPYELDPDGDDDGVLNEDDVYPLDPAASVDSDGDGYPDAWNPGKSELDSTLDLVLDAFPDDFACQLVEHGVEGECDFHRVVSPGDEPLCESDREAPNRSSGGFVELDYALDMIPLCDGWVIVSHQEPTGISFYNAVEDRLGEFYELPQIPRYMALDAESKLLYVVYPGAGQGGAIFDLVTREFSSIGGDFSARDIAVVPGQGLAIISPYINVSAAADELFWLPIDETTALGPWDFRAVGIEADPVDGDVFAIAEGREQLDHYAFDEDTGPTLLDSTEIEWSGDLEVSPDGSLVTPITNWEVGEEEGVYAFDGAAISGPTIGPWIVDSSINALSFDLDSERLLTYSGRFALVFDTTTHEELSRRRISACENDIPAARFSRGGDIAFTLFSCRRGRESRIDWFIPAENDPWP